MITEVLLALLLNFISSILRHFSYSLERKNEIWAIVWLKKVLKISFFALQTIIKLHDTGAFIKCHLICFHQEFTQASQSIDIDGFYFLFSNSRPQKRHHLNPTTMEILITTTPTWHGTLTRLNEITRTWRIWNDSKTVLLTKLVKDDTNERSISSACWGIVVA